MIKVLTKDKTKKEQGKPTSHLGKTKKRGRANLTHPNPPCEGGDSAPEGANVL